jgi:putative restriction endonuclease
VRGYIANTDHDWFDFLAGRDEDEVNFWTPSARAFRALKPGEPLLFRLKSPRHVLGGFGLFSRYTTLPDWYAWETFRQGNGVASFAELDARLQAIRRRNDIDGPRHIGCILLTQPVFLPRDLWVRLPSDWSKNIVSGKGYDLARGEGARAWQELLNAARLVHPAAPLTAEPRFAEATTLRRLGQRGFRVAVLDAYGRACAVTREHSLPVLEAAHIRPYAEGGEHSVANGLLLRSDIHRLYDRGYVTVSGEGAFQVSPRLRSDFDNGKVYYALDGQLAELPDPPNGPDRELLDWHARRVFLH